MEVPAKRGDCGWMGVVLSRMSKNDCSNCVREVDFEDNRPCVAAISSSREVKHGTGIEFNKDGSASFARGD